MIDWITNNNKDILIEIRRQWITEMVVYQIEYHLLAGRCDDKKSRRTLEIVQECEDKIMWLDKYIDKAKAWERQLKKKSE